MTEPTGHQVNRSHQSTTRLMHIRAYFARITDRTLRSIMRSRPSENLLEFSARGENCSDGKSLLLDIIFDNVAVFIGDKRQRQVNLVVPFPT